jgi:hypothetical protein
MHSKERLISLERFPRLTGKKPLEVQASADGKQKPIFPLVHLQMRANLGGLEAISGLLCSVLLTLPSIAWLFILKTFYIHTFSKSKERFRKQG